MLVLGLSSKKHTIDGRRVPRVRWPSPRHMNEARRIARKTREMRGQIQPKASEVELGNKRQKGLDKKQQLRLEDRRSKGLKHRKKPWMRRALESSLGHTRSEPKTECKGRNCKCSQLSVPSLLLGSQPAHIFQPPWQLDMVL